MAVESEDKYCNWMSVESADSALAGITVTGIKNNTTAKKVNKATL